MSAAVVRTELKRKIPPSFEGPSPDTRAHNELLGSYMRLRGQTEELVAPLGAEDMALQSMPDASPAKWHLAHTTWFFETFLLSEHLPGYQVFDPAYGYLFNSYYDTLGQRQPRAQRGVLSRPPVDDIVHYRHDVDEHMRVLLLSGTAAGIEDLILLGLAHEAQHQELLLMDILHLFSQSPLKPGYNELWSTDATGRSGRFRRLEGGLVKIGDAGKAFAFDKHARPTYRNFFPPEQRWMVSGLRLARDAAADYPRQPLSHNPEFAADVIAGLSSSKKTLSPKYFYDAAGSDLFEAICLVDEYYPTRTETALLKGIAAEIAVDIPAGSVLVEFGSGASDKTRLILDAAPHIAAYVPIDISEDALDKATARLMQNYPKLLVAPMTDDFTNAIQLPAVAQGRPKIGFFPGSTIGNFTVVQAVQFLRSVRRLLGDDALLLVGADMVKEEATLVAAYDDAAGVTAQFNKNLLLRINRELGGDFDTDTFDHLAVWNAEHQRIEMHLVSRFDQIINAAGHTFAFSAGERLHTENSHKFTSESFANLAAQAGWTVKREWLSAAPQFGVFSLTVSRR